MKTTKRTSRRGRPTAGRQRRVAEAFDRLEAAARRVDPARLSAYLEDLDLEDSERPTAGRG